MKKLVFSLILLFTGFTVFGQVSEGVIFYKPSSCLAPLPVQVDVEVLDAATLAVVEAGSYLYTGTLTPTTVPVLTKLVWDGILTANGLSDYTVELDGVARVVTTRIFDNCGGVTNYSYGITGEVHHVGGGTDAKNYYVNDDTNFVPAAPAAPAVPAVPITGDQVITEYRNGFVVSTYNGLTYDHVRHYHAVYFLPNVLDYDTADPNNTQGVLHNASTQYGETLIQDHPNGQSYWTSDGAQWVLNFFVPNNAPDPTITLVDGDLVTAGSPTDADVTTYIAANGPYTEGTKIIYVGGGTADDPDYVWVVEEDLTNLNIEAPGGTAFTFTDHEATVLAVGNGVNVPLHDDLWINAGEIGVAGAEYSDIAIPSHTNHSGFGVINSNTSVNSGETSTVIGGFGVNNSGRFSIVHGGFGINTGNESFVGGRSPNNSGLQTIVHGLTNTNSGTAGITTGTTNNNSSDYSSVVGRSNTVTGGESMNVSGSTNGVTTSTFSNITGLGLTVTNATSSMLAGQTTVYNNADFTVGNATNSNVANSTHELVIGDGLDIDDSEYMLIAARASTYNTVDGLVSAGTTHNYLNASHSIGVGDEVDISNADFSQAFGNVVNVSADGAMARGLIVDATGQASLASGAGDLANGFPILAAGAQSFIHSHNDLGQTAGHGALAEDSAILGGKNHNIPADSGFSGVIGGIHIKAYPTLQQEVYLPNLTLWGTGIDGQNTPSNYRVFLDNADAIVGGLLKGQTYLLEITAPSGNPAYTLAVVQ